MGILRKRRYSVSLCFGGKNQIAKAQDTKGFMNRMKAVRSSAVGFLPAPHFIQLFLQ
jgi:hypothetical protein